MPRRFEGILAIEGEPTGDGRMIDEGAMTWGDGPWPLRWQEVDTPGHLNSTVVGTIERLWRDGANLWAAGFLHDDSQDPQTQRAVTRVAELIELDTVGVSIGFDDESIEVRVDQEKWEEWKAEIEAWMRGEVPDEEVVDGQVIVDRFAVDDWMMVFTAGRFREATIVDTGAIADAALELADDEVAVAASLGLVPAVSVRDRVAAFANPNFGTSGDDDPRLVWQEPQRPEEPGGWGCPLTIADDGAFFGHATLSIRCHGAYAACLPPPDQGGDLSRFLIGDATGTGLPTGPIILNTDHGVTANGRVKSHDHLANTGVSIADAAAGFDQHGLWVAGRIRPGVTDRELAAFRGSTLSGEWHPINGRNRLVGVLAVNGPGYLVQRIVRDETGVAAAMFTVGATCCGSDEKSLEERLATLERAMASTLMRGVR